MSDHAQEVFDNAETIGLALHHMAGCEAALYDVFDRHLGENPQGALKAYSLLTALGAFRTQAAGLAETIARQSAG